MNKPTPSLDLILSCMFVALVLALMIALVGGLGLIVWRML